jgi:hypothetical protein
MKATVIQENDFDGLLVDSVDETLTDILGARFKETFYRQLELRFCMPKGSLPDRLDDFVAVLSAIFGPTGSLVMGRTIAKRLYSKLGIQFTQKPGYTLLNYASDAKIVAHDLQLH